MNKTLFMASLKANYAMVLGFTGFTLIYIVVSIAMFQPQSTDVIDAMLTMLPEEMVKAFGFDQLTGELTTYLAGYLFGFILLVFPMIYSILVANNLVSKLVDKGSMAYLLTSTNTRIKVLVTQYAFLAASLFAIFAIDYLVTLVLSAITFPGDLDLISYFQLNLVTYSAMLVVASIAFLFACIFSESRKTLSVAGGIGVIFVVARMLSSLNEEAEFFKFFTIFTLVDTERSLNEAAYAFGVSGLMIVISLLIGGLGIALFNKRSLVI